MSRPAAFLDRDGTIVQEAHYLADPDAVVLVPGAADAIRSLQDAGFAVVIVTNQSGIAKGMYTLSDYRAVAARLDELLAAHRVAVDGTYFCPHHPAAVPCSCRKPDTGMYEAAALELGLDFEDSFFVGDKVTDVLPSLALGGRGILVRTGYGTSHESQLPEGVIAVDDLPAAAAEIVASTRR